MIVYTVAIRCQIIFSQSLVTCTSKGGRPNVSGNKPLIIVFSPLYVEDRTIKMTFKVIKSGVQLLGGLRHG